jgi:hypothetical protein
MLLIRPRTVALVTGKRTRHVGVVSIVLWYVAGGSNGEQCKTRIHGTDQRRTK